MFESLKIWWYGSSWIWGTRPFGPEAIIRSDCLMVQGWRRQRQRAGSVQGTKEGRIDRGYFDTNSCESWAYVGD